MLWRRLLADLVVVAHAAYVSFVVLGLVAILAGVAFGWKWVRNPWFRWIHISMIGIVVAEALAGIPCPLTVWERQLRARRWPGRLCGRLHRLLDAALAFVSRGAMGFYRRLHGVRPGGPGRLHPGATPRSKAITRPSRPLGET